MALVGREMERTVIEALLESGSGALVVRGEAGIGKTALLEHAVARASGMKLLRARGIASESDLPLAGLHQLDRLTAGTNLLSHLSAAGPVLCVVDDADRLDRESLDALTFVARRLRDERVVLLLAARTAVADDLLELRVGRLDRPTSAAIFDAHVGRPVSPYVRERLLGTAAGNPLALVELARALSDEQLDGRESISDPPPATERVQRLFVHELAELAPADREELLVRAAGGDHELGHPLLRSAVYHSASPAARRRAHELVAAESADRARAAWHRAAALADELEAMTDDDAVLERAALLTADPVNRARRFVAAAESARRDGRGGLALALASEAQRLTTDPSALRVRALVEADAGSPSDAAALLLAEGLLPDALAVAADHGDARAALAAAAGLGTPLAYGLAEILAGQGPEGLRSLRASGSADAVVLLYLGDFEAARQALAAEVAQLRADGANGLLPAALGRLAFAEAAEGRLAAAGATAAEGLRLAEETGQLTWACRHRALLAWAAAAAGREEECRAAAQDAFRLAARHGLGLSADIAAAALGELELALGRPEEALARFSELSHHLVRVAAAPSLVEAAARAGQSDVASAASAALEAWIDADAPPRLHALLERCRALCSEGDEAIAHFDEALRLRADARTRLLYGEFLRRARRRREARAQLQSALDAFERLDAGAWAERARAELRGSGIVVQRGDRSLAEQLTPQELQVARLVAAGATNKHVAAQLYLSPRTIDFHLRNVYAKLGITSRFQLVALRADLDSGDSAGAKLRLAA